MTAPHPLDRPVWQALTTRQARFALGDGPARRFQPDIGLFGAAADGTPEALAALAALVPTGGELGLVEIADLSLPPGLALLSRAICDQMVAPAITPGDPDFVILPLGDADAAEMQALAALTRPGPFFARTHRLSAFIGVRVDGALVAMAGERMQLPGFAEVSGVCTHPDHRGRGYAAGLIRTVARRILARGDTPFLHSYSANTGANALYAALGFTLRRPLIYTILTREPAAAVRPDGARG